MQNNGEFPARPTNIPFLSAIGESEISHRLAEKDWGQTPLGRVGSWSDALKFSTQLILTSHFPMAIQWGPELVMIYNDAYAPILGDKHPRALGQPAREVWPEIYDQFGPLSLSILRGERECFFKENHRSNIQRRNGVYEDAFFTISYSPIADPTAANRIGGILITTLETSDAIRRHRKLRQFTGHLELKVTQRTRERDRIWQLSEDLLGVANFEGYFESVNPAWTSLLGWTEDEIKRMHVNELRHPEDTPTAVAQYERLANGVPSVRMENRFRHKDGSWRWLYWTLTAEEGKIYLIGRHITAEKDAVARLRESEQKFRLLVNAVRDYALFQLTPEGFVSSWNIAAERIKGYRSEEIIGQHFSRFYTPEDQRADLPSKALRTAAEVGRYETEAWRIRKDGSRFFATVVIDAIKDENNSLIGFAKIIRDITDRHEAQIELERTQERLAQSQKMEALGQLTGGIAHDFNNMLMVLTGYTEILKSKLVDPRDRRAIAAIEKATLRAENLTQQLLTFSRRQPLNPKILRLAECFESCRDVLAATVSGDIDLEINVPTRVWPVTIDQSEFDAAMINLLVNAGDAMSSGGIIRINGRNATFDNDRETPHLKGDFVVIDVQDNGKGIPPEILPKVFDPFFTTKGVDEGTGLGLSQVYGFAHQAGGTVTVSTEIGIGTTVTLYLPRATPQANSQVAKKQTELPTGDERVLVVEDNEEVQSVTTAMLEQLGYHIATAENATQALEILESREGIDLLLTDIVMPGHLNGLDLAGELKRHHSEMPVLLTTGYTKTLPESFSDYPILRKPYTSASLAKAVRQTIDKRRFA